MSAESEKILDTFADQLASFDHKLETVSGDVDLLSDLHEVIGNLLAAEGGGEEEIREVLQQRYDDGVLRQETFQLVGSMLDSYVSEGIPTAPIQEGDKSTRRRRGRPAFEATQKIDMGELAKAEPVVEIGSRGAAAKVDKAFSKEEAAIPLTTDFDPLADLDERNDIPPPDIRKDAERVNAAADEADDKFGSTTVIPGDVMKDSSADMRVQVGSLLRDRFLLQEKIAGGSMGVVYKALDRRLAEAGSESQWVAIKVLSPKLAKNAQALRALQQEAAKGRYLLHDHIVRFIDLDRDDDLYFIVMEWMEGRTLADILDSKEQNVVDAEAAFCIVRQVGEALAYAHRCGIVHADIKPGNIMILPNGDAKLFDFGVARVQQSQGDEDFDPGVLGALTPAYSSMQVLTGDEPVVSDDVFSLGCLLYRLVAGYRVFGPRNAAEASQEGMKPQRVKGFSDAQWSALKKALSYSRITRFGSMQEFLDALEDDGPQTISLEAPQRFVEMPEKRRRVWPLLLLLLAAGGFGAWQTGVLQPYISEWLPVDEAPARVRDNDTPSLPEPAVATENTALPEQAAVAEEPQAEQEAVVTPAEPTDPDAIGPASTLVDFSTLPVPDVIIPLAMGSAAVESVTVFVRENAEPAIIDFIRDGDLSTELNIRLDEVGFSGNRSPWGSGQYALSNEGQVHFPVGQARGRVSLTMASDPLREADQQSTLRVREAGFAGSELAVVEVILEDDDQRAFEASLPANTVAFAASQASIRETDPAVQIDLVRFNPDDEPLVVGYTVHDVTATDGEDYFAPGNFEIAFGPRQRSARLLIPLVQDSDIEGDETFIVELEAAPDGAAIDVYKRIAVMIRDDEPQFTE